MEMQWKQPQGGAPTETTALRAEPKARRAYMEM